MIYFFNNMLLIRYWGLIMDFVVERQKSSIAILFYFPEICLFHIFGINLKSSDIKLNDIVVKIELNTIGSLCPYK